MASSLALPLLKGGRSMKKSAPNAVVARKRLEAFRQENRQYERLLKLLNSVGTVADRIRQALDEADRALSVGLEIRKVRQIIEAELQRGSKSAEEGASRAPARYETNGAALQASNAKLLEAVQQRARENQLLVCRALAMSQAIINAVGAPKPAANSDAGSNQGTGLSAAA